VVLLVGAAVVALVVILNLIPRLSDGQKVLDHARPAFSPARVTGDRAAINMVSSIVDLADPIVNDQGGAAAEVPKHGSSRGARPAPQLTGVPGVRGPRVGRGGSSHGTTRGRV
jgi:hypothetical protein